MPPEDIPEDTQRSFPCPMCGGEVTLIDGNWTCSDCSFEEEDMPMPEDDGGAIPLAAGLHHDGTIHIYTDGADSGLWVGRDGKGGLIVGVNEDTRMAAKGGDR